VQDLDEALDSGSLAGRIGGMKFSIRDLIWLTVVVALGCGWFLAQSRMMTGLESETRRRISAEQRNAVLQGKLANFTDIDTNDP
jgi:hypothetical protein